MMLQKLFLQIFKDFCCLKVHVLVRVIRENTSNVKAIAVTVSKPLNL